jgi:AmmeMemoRadiSam system protein A
MSFPDLDAAPRPSLRGVARDAIEHGLREGGPPLLDLAAYPAAFAAPRASFVTLRCAGALRGCTGSLEPEAPLVVGVARNAFRAAFADPRFPPLARPELEDLEISVALLSGLERLAAASERHLLAQLRPGVDGLVLHEGALCATFLPAVWESLPEPREFLHALERKAGLEAGHWSSTLRFERYTTEPAD